MVHRNFKNKNDYDFFITLLLWIILYSIWESSANARPLTINEKNESRTQIKLAKQYLKKYGYLREEGETKEDFHEALRKLQNDFGLIANDSLNDETLSLMNRPRCGNPSQPADEKRRKRFVPHKPKWDRRTLTWKLSDPFKLLASYDMFTARNTMHRAFDDWSVATRRALRFVEVRNSNETTDLEIFFALGNHNDTLDFDGPNGAVAHGFYPTDGNLHFDAAEKWTLNMPEGVNLYQTAVHEIGHLLGLEHSTDYRAVMFPINRSYDPQFQLSDDDIRGIRYLYNPWIWSYYIDQYYVRGPSEANEQSPRKK